MLTQHCTRDIAGHYAIACNVHFCGYSDSVLGSLIMCKHLAVMLDMQLGSTAQCLPAQCLPAQCLPAQCLRAEGFAL